MPPSQMLRALLGSLCIGLLAQGCSSSTVPSNPDDDDSADEEMNDAGTSGDGDGDGDGDEDPGDGDQDPGDGDDSGDGDQDPGDGDTDPGDGDGKADAGVDVPTDGRELCPGGEPPPETWQEHWFEHDRNVQRVFYDDCAAIYFDEDVDREQAKWLYDFVGDVWAYSLKTYGNMGPDRIFAIFHQGKYYGGHPAYWFSDFHDYRNTSDVGGNSFPEGDYDVTSHEIGHVVESTAAHSKHGSPAFGLWGDSKWMEFYQYDVYVGLGMEEHAQVVFDRFTGQVDNFPRNDTHWFRDWFYPLWRDYGHAQVMVRFFGLLEQHFPADQNGNMRGMNWGEYIHFTSGAAGKNLKDMATQAFGWPDEWESQFKKAQSDFPAITY